MNTKPLLFASILFTFSYAAVHCDDFYDGYDATDWDNWAKNLNKNINQRVSSSLRGLKNLDNLGPTISQRVQESLKPLDNLGDTISQQVHEGLRPVREMQFRFRVKYGNGGTTVATFKNKRFIVRNGVMYECSGTISDTDGSCSGTLNKAAFNKKEDFCFANVNTIINNWYCISNGQVNSGYINGKVYCNSSDGNPTLLISGEEYKRLCGNIASTVTYKYFTNQPLGEHGSDVQCSGTRPYVCTMTETNNLNVVNAGVSYINVN